MNPADSVKRAALNAAIDYLLADPERNMTKAMEAVNKYAPAGIFPAQRQAFANAIENETNWYQLLLKIAHLNPEMTGGLLKTFVVDANFLAWGKQEKMRAKYGCNIPWAILLDPTRACNPHCLGCWAADCGHKLNLAFEDIDSIICQGKERGVLVYIYTGEEPLVRKDDLIALCRKHPDCAFLCFTNATLIDEKFCQDMIEVKNFIPAISAEGFEETTDARCGEGTYKRIQHGMELLREQGLPFGVSTCLTRCARLSSWPTTMSSHSTATTCDRAPSSTTPIAWRKWCARRAPTPPTSYMKKASMTCAPSARNPRSNGIPLPPSCGTTPTTPAPNSDSSPTWACRKATWRSLKNSAVTPAPTARHPTTSSRRPARRQSAVRDATPRAALCAWGIFW